MTYKGEFNDYKNEYRYRVTIETPAGITNQSDNIIDPFDNTNGLLGDLLYFSPDPVHIKCDRSDLTQLIMITQAEIKFKGEGDMYQELFTGTNRTIRVKVERISEINNYARTLFFGYIDPLQFEQGFAHKYEEITVHATDPLGALQDLKISDIEGLSKGSIITVQNLIYKIFQTCFKPYTSGNETIQTFNGLKTFLHEAINLNMIQVNTSVFYGDSEDDYMNLYDVLNELLKYAGCTVSYEPHSGYVYLYSLYSLSDDQSETWFDVKEKSMDTSASIGVDTAYSQITLTCEINPNDDTISLTDNDSLYSDYSNYQKYMTELISEGKSGSAYNGFKELLYAPDGQERSSSYEKAYRIDNYCWVKRNDAWNFGPNSYIEIMGGKQMSSTQAKEKMKSDQSIVLQWLKDNPGKAAFVSFGRGSKLKRTDNSPVANIPMKDYLVISIGGQNDHRTSNNAHNARLSYTLERNQPLCKYTGLNSVNLIPADEDITNYIVISGNIILNPLQPKTGWNWADDIGHVTDYHHDEDNYWINLYTSSTNTYTGAKDIVNTFIDDVIFGHFALAPMVVRYEGEDNVAYYSQKWWALDLSVPDCSPRKPTYTPTFQSLGGYLENKENTGLIYSWTTIGNDDDVISKLPVLACQLKVGDKYCVERLDHGIEGQGIFEWMTMEEWQSYPKLQEFGYPYFTIGINPKTDDKMVGQSFEIQNNISYTMNVDATGTAIPIKMSDGLNGVVEFSILGPINGQWNEIERIHPTWFRSTSWTDHKYYVLELLESILVSDLKIDFKTDYGLYNEKMTTADNDLVYYSVPNPMYTEKLECDLKICTPLTLEECITKGIKYQTSNSYVTMEDNLPFYGWTKSDVTRKPEELFIDYYYKQYNMPARMLTINVDNGDIFGNTTIIGGDNYVSFGSIMSKYTVNIDMPGIDDPYDYFVMSMDWSLKRRANTMSVRQKFAYDDPFVD